MKHTLSPRKDGVALFAAAIAAVAPFANTQARSMLYYCDFDTVTDGTLTWVNKGTGEVEPTVYQNGATAPGYAEGGPWGSGYALRENVYTTLLLGDGSASLGCGTTKGFTISSSTVPANSTQRPEAQSISNTSRTLRLVLMTTYSSDM